MAVKSLGERMRARRVELGLTIAQVAERSQLSLPYISNLERNRGNPTIDALRAIAAALDVSVSALTLDQPDAETPAPEAAPKTLMAFVKTDAFRRQTATLAARQGVSYDEMRDRLVTAMSAAPRRSTGEPTEGDWRRLLDAYRLILDEPD